MSSSLQKLVIVFVILLLGGFFGYSFYTSTTQLVPINNTSIPGQSGVKSGQDISSLVDRLKAVTINTSLFSSPLFLYLKDVSVPILPEPQGRINPFASIGIDASSGSTQIASPLPQTKTPTTNATNITRPVTSKPTTSSPTSTPLNAITQPLNLPTAIPHI